MTKEAAILLEKEALRTAISYSDPGRENPRIVEVHEIIPLSDEIASVLMETNEGRRILFVFFYTRQDGGSWLHFVPTDSQILGLSRVEEIKGEVELYNYHQNFHGDQLERGWSPARALLANRRVRVLLSLLGLENAPASDFVRENGVETRSIDNS